MLMQALYLKKRFCPYRLRGGAGKLAPFIMAWLVCSAPAPAAAESLQHLGARHGFTLYQDTDNRIELRNEFQTLRFEPFSRKLWINGTLVWMNAPLAIADGKNEPASCDLYSSLLPFFNESGLHTNRIITVVIDPGHGGMDGGAISRSDEEAEKRIVLEIAKTVRRRLAGTGINVLMTRTGDQTLSLDERVAFARQRRADIFLSIHLNAAPRRDAHGIETYIMPSAGYPATVTGRIGNGAYNGNSFDGFNTLLAFYLQKSALANVNAEDRGVKRARYEVLRQAACPAALIECGFLSNPTESERLQKPDYRIHIANGVANGLLTYIRRVETMP